MNDLSLALKKANIITDEDIERVERQKRIEAEQERKEKEKRKIDKLINSINTRFRDAIISIRKKDPEAIPIRMLEMLAGLRKNPCLLLNPDVEQTINRILIEKIHLDCEEAIPKDDSDKLD